MPLAANLPRPRSGRWLAHFNLTLPLAARDARDFLSLADAAGADAMLVDSADQISDASAADLVVFAGHGDGLGADQHLVLANGARVFSTDIESLPTGCTVVLHACWAGFVLDRPATEQVDLPLVLLGRGAHSVVGTLGPVLDVDASAMFAPVMSRLAKGDSASQALNHAIRSLLSEDPLAPLSAWASYVTVGRHPSFAGSVAE